MTLPSGDLERIADDIYRDRRITSSVYCGYCGYNLRTLPYAYKCPECGREYNARPLTMKGIFNPYALQFPFRDLVVTCLCAFSAAVLGFLGARPLDPVPLGAGAFFAVFAIVYGRHVYTRTRLFFRAIGIVRRITAEERADEP